MAGNSPLNAFQSRRKAKLLLSGVRHLLPGLFPRCLSRRPAQSRPT